MQQQQQKTADVVIVGAGIAGLTAADHLRRNGVMNVVILEASSRYGGRLFTAPHGDAYLEYGANWIHGGSEENELFKLARQRSLLSDTLNLENRTKGLFYTSAGQTIDGQLGEKCYQLFFDAEMEAGRLYRSDSRMKQRLANKSLLQYLEEVWQRLAEKEFGADLNDPVRQQAESIFRSMILYFRAHVGNDLALVPAILHGTFENVAEEDVKMPNGMRALVDEFYVNLPKGTIEFDTTVTGIFWSSDESGNGSSSTEWLDHPVKITTDHGVNWRAKHVICTLPLGVLKRSHDKIFHPPLPPLKVKAIETIGFGKVEKVFVEFDQPFWEPGFGGVKLAWTAEDLAEKLLPRDWYKVICSFEEVYRQPNVLAAWVSGREAEAMLSLSEEEILETCTRLLRTFTANPGMVAPVRILRSNWLDDPLFCGSYSYPTFHSSHRSFSDLATPIPCEKNPRVLFAGEATHDHYYSTLHAAYITGKREADRIIPFILQSNKHFLKHKL
ncbi:hypothetical protein GHT06_010122 [Daphnia sinensis]|uniref:Amine oxidase domain-containing protein n=1 Tax=Daphnia sinensis TaxID=1820382 RepID=A0AAD5LRJ8_9CRUS|nr:hypothetical protein GHT06_010122 [Daphnia sinensis]